MALSARSSLLTFVAQASFFATSCTIVAVGSLVLMVEFSPSQYEVTPVRRLGTRRVSDDMVTFWNTFMATPNFSTSRMIVLEKSSNTRAPPRLLTWPPMSRYSAPR